MNKEYSANDSIRTLKVENSDVVKHALVSLINVASTKTSKAYARATMKALLHRLEKDHYIIKYIKVEDLEDSANNIESITVMTKANSYRPEEVGRAFRKLAKAYHPDLNKGDQLLTRKFIKAKDAYDKIIAYLDTNEGRAGTSPVTVNTELLLKDAIEDTERRYKRYLERKRREAREKGGGKNNQ